jgi:protein-glutamine gamma-glutamyltransferase
VSGVLGVLFTYRTFNGLEAGGGLLVVMGAMKLLETRARRDIQVLVLHRLSSSC